MSLDVQIFLMLIVASVNLVLAGIVLGQHLHDRLHIAFGALAMTAALWGLTTALFLFLPDSAGGEVDFIGRLSYVMGDSIPTTFLYFTLVYTSARPLPKWLSALVLLPIPLAAGLFLGTDLLIYGLATSDHVVRGYQFGPLEYLFELHLWGYFALAFVIFVRRLGRYSGHARVRVVSVFTSTYMTLAIAGVTNVILPRFYGVYDYRTVGPIVIIGWVWTIAYSVARVELFRIRIVSAEFVVAILWFILVLRAFLSPDPVSLVLNTTFFFIILVVGVFLIRSSLREVEQRDVIEDQRRSLARVNTQQEALLHFISHEIKSYFAKIEAAFAGISEGDYGAVPAPIKTLATGALADMRTGTGMVMNVLDAADLKKGVVTYHRESFDLVAAAGRVLSTLRSIAEAKGLTFVTKIVPASCFVMGDEDKLREHVLRNLVDNSIRYTQAGTITVTVERSDTHVRFIVEDTGVGITSEDMARLFTEGGHGKDSIKINVHSTGFGLYIAKQVVEAHHGTITAFSRGAGLGSRFVVELPLHKA